MPQVGVILAAASQPVGKQDHRSGSHLLREIDSHGKLPLAFAIAHRFVEGFGEEFLLRSRIISRTPVQGCKQKTQAGNDEWLLHPIPFFNRDHRTLPSQLRIGGRSVHREAIGEPLPGRWRQADFAGWAAFTRDT
jgi:hypothetical protein